MKTILTVRTMFGNHHTPLLALLLALCLSGALCACGKTPESTDTAPTEDSVTVAPQPPASTQPETSADISASAQPETSADAPADTAPEATAPADPADPSESTSPVVELPKVGFD